MLCLNIIGCGKVAQSLARLWIDRHQVRLVHICNRHYARAQQAAQALGQGEAVAHIEALGPADLTLIGTDDDAIGACVAALAANPHLASGQIVFHCSGALSAEVLDPVRGAGARPASLHPLRSFSRPLEHQSEFTGTFCALEGDTEALATLSALVEAIDGEVLRIDPAHKSLYHAAAVVACNYFTTLEAQALRLYGAAGIDRPTALKLLAPLLRGTLENLLAQGPEQALTGPIRRGDHATVARHLQALERWDPDAATLYRLLGQHTLALAASQAETDLTPLRQLLRETDQPHNR